MPPERDHQNALRKQIRFRAGPSAVRGVMAELTPFLSSGCAQNHAMAENAILAITEVLNNIVEHSYAKKSGGEVEIEIALMTRKIDVVTRDYGKPMPGLTLPKMTTPNIDVKRQDLQEGGFGWYLIHLLSSKKQYSRRDGKNVLRFTVGEREKRESTFPDSSDDRDNSFS